MARRIRNKLTVVILLDHNIRYVSSHEYFYSKSHFGYYPISKEALANLPDDIHDSLVKINVPPLIIVCNYGVA